MHILEYHSRLVSDYARYTRSVIKITNTAGMNGELQGIIGNALPDVKTLELPERAEGSSES